MLLYLYAAVKDHVCEASHAPRLHEITNVVALLCCGFEDHVCEASRAPRLHEITNVVVPLCYSCKSRL